MCIRDSYRSYGESQNYMRLPEIFMPTEFLHGLYDGGHGAGLYDYWEMMRKHPRCAGGFLWVLADEGVKRVDMNGFIDKCGNYGADGIVGPVSYTHLDVYKRQFFGSSY